MRSLFTERHIWYRHPFVAYTMLDKFFNPITLLAGPITIIYLCTRPVLYLPIWVILTSYAVWLLLTRLIKYIPHFIRRPQDVIAVPVWIVFNIYFALMKVYCLLTLHVTDWGTRVGADDEREKEDDMDLYLVHADIVDRSKSSKNHRRRPKEEENVVVVDIDVPIPPPTRDQSKGVVKKGKSSMIQINKEDYGGGHFTSIDVNSV